MEIIINTNDSIPLFTQLMQNFVSQAAKGVEPAVEKIKKGKRK